MIKEIQKRIENILNSNDVPEFIRNVDMVVDLVEDTGVGKGIANMFNKINSFIGKFGKKTKK